LSCYELSVVHNNLGLKAKGF